MHYTDEKALEEILKRSEIIKKQKEAGKIRTLSVLTVLLFAGLITSVVSLAKPEATLSTETSYGAFLLSSNAGGYVLVAVIAFIAGVVLTVLISKYRKIQKNDTDR